MPSHNAPRAMATNLSDVEQRGLRLACVSHRTHNLLQRYLADASGLMIMF